MGVDEAGPRDGAPDAGRLRDELAELATADPLGALRALAEITRWADELARTAVARARSEGASWAAIGAAVGTSRQAAHERFRAVPPAASDGGRPVRTRPPSRTPAAVDRTAAADGATAETAETADVPATRPVAQPPPLLPLPLLPAPLLPAPPAPPPADPVSAAADPARSPPEDGPPAEVGAEAGVGLLALDGVVDLVAARQPSCPACGYWTWRPCDEHLPAALASTPAHPPRWTGGEVVEVRPLRRQATVATLAGWRPQTGGGRGRWVYRVDLVDDGAGRAGPGWWPENALRRSRTRWRRPR